MNKINSLKSKMSVYGKQILSNFIQKHTDAKKWIEAWIADIEGSALNTPQDIKNKYSSASFLGDSIVIFNVKGNKYRLEVKVAYQRSIVIVQWIGTHAEYDKRTPQEN